MKYAKRLIAFLLLAALLLCLTGCTEKNTAEEPQPQETAEPTVTEVPAAEETPVEPELFEPDESIMMPEGTLVG